MNKPSSYFAQDSADLDNANIKISRRSAIYLTTNMCIYRVFLQYAVQHRKGCYAKKYREKCCLRIYP